MKMLQKSAQLLHGSKPPPVASMEIKNCQLFLKTFIIIYILLGFSCLFVELLLYYVDMGTG